VSYYRGADVLDGKVWSPSANHNLIGLQPRLELGMGRNEQLPTSHATGPVSNGASVELHRKDRGELRGLEHEECHGPLNHVVGGYQPPVASWHNPAVFDWSLSIDGGVECCNGFLLQHANQPPHEEVPPHVGHD
jgi:hypothetical protein